MSAVMFWMLNYLMNSLWMVPLIFLAAWLMALMVRRTGTRTEHVVWVTALLLEVVLPACKVHLDGVVRAMREMVLWHWGRGASDGVSHVNVSMGPVFARSGVTMPHGLTLRLLAIYGCATFYFAARLMWGIWRTRAIECEATTIELSGETTEVWRRCCTGFAITGATVAESHEITGPVTMGIRHDLLVLPRGFLSRVAEDDLEAVMAHECAHMRRRDFAKNLLYRVLSLPVMYHPMLWLTLSRITESREIVCDAMAAEMVEGEGQYARSLLRLASMVATTTPARTLHAIGIFDANTFERRVMRLAMKREEIGRVMRAMTALTCVAVGAVTCASALALRMEITAPATSANQNEKQTALKVAPGVIAGNVIYQKHPVYPAEAKTNKDTLNGPVVLYAIISKEGLVKELSVKQSLRADYDQAALDAVKEWRYKPFLLNGDPTEVETTITVNYNIGK
jgi:TonB family protein